MAGTLREWTNAELAAELSDSARRQRGHVAALLEEAAARLAILAGVVPSFRIASIRLVCENAPTLFDGVLENGDEFFLKYTKGKLTAFVDDVLSGYDEPDLDDPERITLEQVRDRLRGQFVFPVSRPVLRKVV